MATIEKRNWSDGTHSYRVKVRIKGCKTETASFDKLADAKKWMVKTESDLRHSLKFDDHHARKHLLKEVINRYVEECLGRVDARHAQQRKKQLEWWSEQLGHHFLADVSIEKINKCKRELSELKLGRSGSDAKLSPATVNHYLISLSAVFTYVQKELNWLRYNPMQSVKKLDLNNSRVRYLTVKERKVLLEKCQARHPLLYLLVLMAISTGMRKGELTALRWKDLDFDNKVARVEQSKNGDKRGAPLTGLALRMLKEQSVNHSGDELIFARADGKAAFEFKRHWEAVVKEAGLVDFRFHDLRHTSATYLLESGASLSELSGVLGHRTIQMVKRYAHLSDNHAVAVAERMTKKVFGDE